MLFTALFQWWYTAGWSRILQALAGRLTGILRLFSVGILLKSLFAPFRETFADSHVRGSMDMQLRAWADKQISRGIGAMLRGAVIVCGILAAAVFCIFALVVLLLWPVVPVLPLLVIIATAGM